MNQTQIQNKSSIIKRLISAGADTVNSEHNKVPNSDSIYISLSDDETSAKKRESCCAKIKKCFNAIANYCTKNNAKQLLKIVDKKVTEIQNNDHYLADLLKILEDIIGLPKGINNIIAQYVIDDVTQIIIGLTKVNKDYSAQDSRLILQHIYDYAQDEDMKLDELAAHMDQLRQMGSDLNRHLYWQPLILDDLLENG